MADIPLLDDNPSTTPLDLLLNAISGSSALFPQAGESTEEGDYLGDNGEGQQQTANNDGMNDSAPAGNSAEDFASRKRGPEDLDEAGEGPPRLSKITRTLSSHFGSDTKGRAFSTVEVWHPKTGQKSYGKERRQPPPTLRVSGPLLPLLTQVTLSTHPNPDPPTGSLTFSSQTHRLALSDIPADGSSIPKTKKAERDERRRQMRQAASKTGWGGSLPWERSRSDVRDRSELANGLTFPGLWIGEETGKNKEFRLELSVGVPGLEAVPATSAPATENKDVEPIDEAALRRVLAAGVEPLMGLEPEESERRLVDLDTPMEQTLESAAETQQTETQQTETQQTDTQQTDPTQTDTQPNTQPSQAQPTEPSKPWATFVSEPLTIVSKPSQKTAKARSMASCLSSTDAFALYVRVNAQTVRTKYMKMDEINGAPILTAKTGKWSPFRFHVVSRASPPEPEDKTSRSRFKIDNDKEAGIITYGSIVQLVDVNSGTRSDPVRLVRVDKNEAVVGEDQGHPVSELQRIGLVRVIDGVDDETGGARWYLSAPGAVAGAGEIGVTRARPGSRNAIKDAATASSGSVPETLGGLDSAAENGEGSSVVAPPVNERKRKRKTKRHALARAAINEEESGSAAAGLVWHQAKRRSGTHIVTEGKVATARPANVETVDDWMSWTLGGVWCFSYSFFNGLGDSESVPRAPLDPVPRLLVDPVLRPEQNTLDLTLSYFFVDDAQGQPQPLSVYIGPIGPLRVTTWRSVAPKEKYFDPGALYPAVPYVGTNEEPPLPEGQRVYSNFPFNVPHAIAKVELPSMEEIIRVMKESAETETTQPDAPAVERPASEQRAVETGEQQQQEAADQHAADDAWLGAMGPAGELTIQEALQNAGKTSAPDHNISEVLGSHVESEDVAKVADNQFAFEQLPTGLIDRSLEEAAAAAAAAGEGETQQDVFAAPSTLALHPPESVPQTGLASLPLLLVRPDGVGYGLGWSIEAERAVQGDEAEEGGRGQNGPSATGDSGTDNRQSPSLASGSGGNIGAGIGSGTAWGELIE